MTFLHALCGIIHCIKNERNMRFHTVAALYVLVFARFFDFTREKYVLLLLTIGSVMAAEVFNTAIEELCDRVSKEYHPLIKYAKDCAAGAVLVLAVFAAVIGVILFGSMDGIMTMYRFYVSHPLHAAGLLLSAVLSVFYVKGRKHSHE